MQIGDVEILTLKLDLIQTLGVSAVLYLLGVHTKRLLPFIDRLNIPSAVIGGMLFAGAALIAHDRFLNLQFDTTTQPLFMVMFFTTIGMGASLPLLRSGGLSVLIFLVMSTAFCFVQNGVGMGIGALFDAPPFLGIMAGSVTLVGGPATGLAFAPLFEKAGLVGADTLAITAATFGIVCGGLVGGPAGTWLINRLHLHQDKRVTSGELRRELAPPEETITVALDQEDSNLVRNLIVAAIAMGIGSVLSYYFQRMGWTLPAYIGAMVIASVLRNVDDVKGWFHIDPKAMDLIGSIALNTFLVVALMNLKLWELFHLATPLFAILVVQALVAVGFSMVISYRVMGRNYDAAVIASGFIGFVLGTTANALANMKTLVGKYGPSPRAFLVVPMVGAFFIDFVNALIITWFLNWLQ